MTYHSVNRDPLLSSWCFPCVPIISFHQILIYFCSDFYYFFPSAKFCFCFYVLSLVILGISLGCLRFFFFPEVSLYCYKLPSWNCFYCVPQVLDHRGFVLISLQVFSISSLISLVISWLFSNVLFSLHVFVFFTGFFSL